MEEQKEYLPAEIVKVTQQDLDNYLFTSGTKLNDQQKKLFYAISLRNNLDPFKREIYAVPYGNNFNIITGYEVYLKRAERSGKLDGWEADYVSDQSGDYAFCTIYRKDRTHPIKQKVWLAEFKQQNRMWNEKPKTMLVKVAIATAFRRAFPDELGGLPYTADEMPSAIPEAEIVQPQAPQEAKGQIKQSAKLKKAIAWTLAQGMKEEEIVMAVGPLELLEDNRLEDLKSAYMAWKSQQSPPADETPHAEVACPNRDGEGVLPETCAKCEMREGCPAQ